TPPFGATSSAVPGAFVWRLHRVARSRPAVADAGHVVVATNDHLTGQPAPIGTGAVRASSRRQRR
ncbi:MAG: hypothetical protein NZ518_02385, partial [Dehalococcoidia bacterium]|nr:hypothetical protein [Dehalococcoidia bacterium]